MNNLVVDEGEIAVAEAVCYKRELLLQQIYASGIKFDLRADTDFTFPVDI